MDDIPSHSPLCPPSADLKEKANEPLRIVGIGAGAGGLEAVQLFFGAMPVSSGLAFVICRFVEPGLADPLAEFLRAQTTMPVIHADDGAIVEADRIYLIPPSARMILLNKRLTSFEEDEDAQSVSPIDLLFHSLGASMGASAIAVILSGHGEDGLKGAGSIRQSGGLVLVQQPESTDYATMPSRVIDAELASAIAPPSAMPDLIQRRIDHPEGDGGSDDKPIADEAALTDIIALLKMHFGIDSRVYRSSLVAKRVRRRFDRSGTLSLKDYAERLTHDQAELLRLHDDLLIGVTAFFRDPEAFMVLETTVVPALVERMSEESPLRIWVPGCATGEEAYSLAMVILDQIDRANRHPYLDVIASDRHARALKSARHGRYRRDCLGDAPSALIAQYMDDRGEHLEVGDRLRHHVTFIEHDLLQAEPPDDIDLVSCRNLIIYLAADCREKALAACCDALKPEGFLFLGPSEQPGRLTDGLVTLEPKWRIYKKKALPKAGAEMLAKLASSKMEHPAETIIPEAEDTLSFPASSQPMMGDPTTDDPENDDDFDGVFSRNQRMLEATIDTLLASNDRLRRQNRDVRQENQRLAAAHAALDDVATMIAHDLKAPLHATERLFLDLKETTSLAVGPEEASRQLRPMQLQLLALDRLVDDLLTYARQGQSTSDDWQNVDMSELLQEILALIGLADGIKVMMQPPNLKISTWRTPLACIMRNLLVRAIQNLEDGQGTIRIDVQAGEKMVEIAITDDGQAVFSQTSTLGLAIIQQLLDASGGRLSLNDPMPDQGQTARFTWPITRPDGQRQQAT